MGIYAAASLSVPALVALIAGVAGFAVREWTGGRRNWWAWALVAVILASSASYRLILTSGAISEDGSTHTTVAGAAVTIPANLSERVEQWRFHGEQLFKDPRSAALGQVAPPDRMRYPSAHNYYLDFAYNFGLIALLPMLGLVAWTLVKAYRHRKAILYSPDLLGLTFIVLFLILVNNSLTVGMRQPYPGIFTFFLWGMLLSRLHFRDADASRENLVRQA
jgi:O-antigen ligase